MKKFVLLLCFLAFVLAQVTVAASNHIKNGEGENESTPNEEIDTKIIGQWSYTNTLSSTYTYQFNADGSYLQVRQWGTYVNRVTGKFHTSGGVVYLTDLILHYTLGEQGEKQEPLKNKSSKYSFGRNDQFKRDYLQIKVFSANDDNPDSEKTYKFYKNQTENKIVPPKASVTVDAENKKDTIPSGSIDQKLTGSWGYFGDKLQPGVYIFNHDGSFIYYAAVRKNYLTAGSMYAKETIYKGNYKIEGNTVVFSDVSIARFDRSKDTANRNRIGDREHAKEMLKITTGFSSWTLESVEFNFIEPSVVRIAKKNDEDKIRTLFRSGWETYDGW